jgi:hypothetical protein
MFDNVKKLDYVSVEVIKKNSNNKLDLNVGLFSGYYRRESDVRVVSPIKNTAFDKILFLLALTCKRDAICYFNMMSYTIVSIEYVIDKVKHITVFNKDKEDQLDALGLLERITRSMVEHKMAREINGTLGKSIVIEPTKYENYPIDVIDSDNNKNNNNSDSKSYSYNNNNNKSYTPKEEVTVINRKGKLPSKKFLDEMKKKVELVSKCELKVKLPKIEEDEIAKEHY